MKNIVSPTPRRPALRRVRSLRRSLNPCLLPWLAMAACGFAPLSFAQAQSDEAAVEEEIVVLGERSLTSLVNEAGNETMRFYDLLNAYLDEPDFAISCYSEFPPGSRISRRVCRTRFQEEELTRVGRERLNDLRYSPGNTLVFEGVVYGPSAQLFQQQLRFEERILEAVNTDPELNASVLRLMTLKDAVDRRRADRGR